MLVNLTMMTLGMWSLSLHEALALIFRWNCLYRYHYCCCCYCYFYYCCEALAMAGVLKMKKIIKYSNSSDNTLNVLTSTSLNTACIVVVILWQLITGDVLVHTILLGQMRLVFKQRCVSGFLGLGLLVLVLLIRIRIYFAARLLLNALGNNALLVIQLREKISRILQCLLRRVHFSLLYGRPACRC